MTTWKQMDARDKVIVIITAVVGLFILITLIGTFVLEATGNETGTVWGRAFDLVGVLAGGLVGYVAGENVQKARDLKQRDDG